MSHPKRTLGRVPDWGTTFVADGHVAPVHASQRVAHGEWVAELDIGIAPFVLELWRAGIETHNSCQDIGEMPELAMP